MSLFMLMIEKMIDSYNSHNCSVSFGLVNSKAIVSVLSLGRSIKNKVGGKLPVAKISIIETAKTITIFAQGFPPKYLFGGV